MGTRRNISKKRSAIYDALASTKEHPTAEALFRKIRPEYPELSLATVYRNLILLEEDGSIVSLGEINGQEHYDANILPHGHFICSCCGKISDFEYPKGGLCDQIKSLLDPGFSVKGYELRLSGICAECSAADSGQTSV